VTTPITNGVEQLWMLQKNYYLTKNCLHQLYLDKIIRQLLYLVFVFTPAGQFKANMPNPIAKASNSNAKATNWSANATGECAPQWLIIEKPISHCASYAAMFCLLHSSKSIEQHKTHLCNPSSHYRKYEKFTREACTPYLDAWKPQCLDFSNIEFISTL